MYSDSENSDIVENATNDISEYVHLRGDDDPRPFKFVLDSDLHFGSSENNGIRPDKMQDRSKIIDLASDPRHQARFVVVPGDLTNNGGDGKYIDFGCYKWYYGGREDQAGAFRKQWVEPLSRHLPVYFGAGNHDTYVPWPYFHKPIFNYVRKQFGSLRYSFQPEPRVNFICLHIYPDADGIKFLRKELADKPTHDHIIFFHYNFRGPLSGWWSQEEKEIFWQTIRDHNIVGLLVGHHHVSEKYEWHGIPVIKAAGSSLALCTYDPYAEQKLDAVFM